ncbi:MAG: hypothetical protein HY716_04300 [Planctomycetes bacterium]|nr:hypothetical protein [Planctomycetota bacterium]
MRGLLLASVASLLVAAANSQEKKKFDPSKHPWVKYKVGSRVCYKGVANTPMGEVTNVLRRELVKVAAGNFIIKETHNFKGKELTEMKMSALPTYVKADKVKVGSEEYPCHVWKSVEKGKTRKTESLVWIDEKNRILKVKSDGGEEIDAVAEELDVEIEVGDKKVSCTKMEGTLRSSMAGIKGKITLWATDQIPGGMAKMILDPEVGGVKMTFEITEFEGKE